MIQEKLPHDDLWLLIGGDSLTNFPTWHKPSEIIKHCRLAVLNRPGYSPDIESISAHVPGLNDQLDWIDGPSIELSSTWLRQHAKWPFQYLVPSAVQTYIRENQLYG